MSDFLSTKEELIENVKYTRIGELSTICCITLKNGFEQIGTSCCANPDDFDIEIGEECAYADAMLKLDSIVAFFIKENT